MTGPVETKVQAGTLSGAVTGLVVWALVAYVPAFHDGVPKPVTDAIPVILAVLAWFIGAYLAPHTNRPDLGGKDGGKPPG